MAAVDASSAVSEQDVMLGGPDMNRSAESHGLTTSPTYGSNACASSCQRRAALACTAAPCALLPRRPSLRHTMSARGLTASPR